MNLPDWGEWAVDLTHPPISPRTAPEVKQTPRDPGNEVEAPVKSLDPPSSEARPRRAQSLLGPFPASCESSQSFSRPPSPPPQRPARPATPFALFCRANASTRSELSLAERWRDADPLVRQHFQSHYQILLTRHGRELRAWRKRLERWTKRHKESQ